jgi:hypothetical protein
VHAFLNEAAGNAADAARLAGFSHKTARQIGARLLTRVHIKAAVEAYRAKLERPTIADATERRETLTTLVRTPGESPAHNLMRIKAADVLNKMDGLYVKKLANPDGSPLRLTPDDAINARIAELERQLGK